MIQRQVKLTRPVRDCACGKQPKLIESRGNPGAVALRTATKPCVVHYHLECAICGLTTERTKRPVGAERAWNAEQLHSLIPHRAVAA